MTQTKPLVLDVDGTFLRTDLLFESFWSGLGHAPFDVLRACRAHFRDRSRLKSELARIGKPRLDLVPVDPNVLTTAQTALEQGHEVLLASAADKPLVQELAQMHGLSDRVFASGGGINLKGRAKAKALVDAFGNQGFHYAGNERIDIEIWKQADEAIIVGPVRDAKASMEALNRPYTQLPGGWRKRDLIRALRPHQYVKNVLLLLPIIAAHQFSFEALLPILFGIIAFSAAASSIYIVNDLLDLAADRLHPKKKTRPFASGAVPIFVGMKACAALMLAALGIAATLNWAFFFIVLLYMGLSLAYSLKLKRMRWIDIATLAGLYTIRVVAGAAAGMVDVTTYMLVFIFPVFVTLGCVKRLTELTLATSDERLPGRGYGRPDRGDLLNVAGLGMFGAMLVFFLYSFTDQAKELYPTQWLLWVAMLPLAAWLFRMVSLGYKGKQDYDPIVFAMRDRHGISLIIFTLTLMFYAAGLFHRAFGY